MSPFPLPSSFKQQFVSFTYKVDQLLTKIQYDLMQKYPLIPTHSKFPSLQSDVQLISQSIILLFQQFQSFTTMLQLQLLNQPLRRILSFQHLFANLILTLYHSASKFFNQKSIRYKSQKLHTLSKSIPSTQCVIVEELTLQKARKQEFQDKERLESMINENQKQQRNDFIEHLSEVIDRMDKGFGGLSGESGTMGELKGVQEKMEEIVQFAHLVEFENKKRGMDRLNYFYDGREEVDRVLDLVVGELGKGIRGKLEVGMKIRMKEMREKWRTNDHKITRDQQAQTQSVPQSMILVKPSNLSSLQKLQNKIKIQENQITTLTQRSLLYKSAIQKSQLQLTSLTQQNTRLTLLVQNLATNLQQASQKSKTNELTAFKTQKNLFDLYDKIEQQQIKLNIRRNGIKLPSLDLIPLESVEIGVQVDETLIGGAFELMGIQKKEISLLNSNIKKEYKIQKLSEENKSLVKNFGFLLEKIGGGEFMKELRVIIEKEGITEGIIEDIVKKYEESLRESNKVKRRSLKQFLIKSMSLTGEDTKEGLLEMEIMEMEEESDEEIQKIIKDLNVNKMQQQSPANSQARAMQRTTKVQISASLNNFIHQNEQPLLSNPQSSTNLKKKLSVQKAPKLRMNKFLKQSQSTTTPSSMTNSFIIQKQNISNQRLNGYRTINIGSPHPQTSSNRLILNQSFLNMKKKTMLEKQLTHHRNIMTETNENQQPTERLSKGRKAQNKTKLNFLTPTFLDTSKLESTQSNTQSKKSSFEKYGTNFKQKMSKNKDGNQIKRGEESVANRILYKNYQIVKQKEIGMLPGDEQLPKLNKLKN